MSFISVLKSIGNGFKIGITKALAVEAKLLPFENVIAGDVALVNPAAGATLQGLLAVVGNVEQVATAVGASSGTGAQKLAAAIPGIEQAILADPLFAGKKIPDLTVYNTAVENFTSALAQLANSFESDTPIPAPTPAPAPTSATGITATE